MAMWDLWGKCSGLPVYELLGGIPDGTRPGAKVAANLFYDPRVTGKEALTELLRFAAQLLEDHGFSVIKYKSFGDPDVDVATMKALRRNSVVPSNCALTLTVPGMRPRPSVCCRRSAWPSWSSGDHLGIEAMSRVRAVAAVPPSTTCITILTDSHCCAPRGCGYYPGDCLLREYSAHAGSWRPFALARSRHVHAQQR